MSTMDSTQAIPASEQHQSAQQSNKDEALACQWSGCNDRCQNPEQLYDHICERHVGRKSTNNLNLTCGWGTCRTTTVKRDHITSHIRVHVPLKPHKCDFCGKSFKRPQDLKKHVKTHADDSVLLRSPEPTGGARPPDPGYRVENGKAIITDLQALAATATGYYENPSHPAAAPQHQGYAHHAPNGNPSAYYGGQPQPYGGVYYPLTQGGDMGHHASFDSKRRNYEALNEFFGDAKRRQLDPNSYHEVGQRLLALQGVDLPSQLSLPETQTSTMVHDGGHGGAVLQHQYALPPMPNLRTKNDLLNIDQFLEQIQSTVYENSNRVAATGTSQPGAQYIHGGLSLRHSQSPPGIQHAAGNGLSAHGTIAPHVAPLMAQTSSQTTQIGTPALTPASSTMSYVSAHSPGSVTSAHGMSPLPRSSAAMYPNLPAVSSMSDVSVGYPTTAGTAPASALGTVFDDDHRRRFSGGVLQRASQPRKGDEMDTSEDSIPSKASALEPSSDPKGTDEKPKQADATSPMVDPTLSGLSSPGRDSSDGETAADKAEEAWIENMRLVEGLRKFVAERLERQEYEREGDEEMRDVKHEDEPDVRSPSADFKQEKTEVEKDAERLYPVLRAVEAT
ncbi:MAG: hypothetical protein M1833_000586 [Piccolia ochrophora]|nr:MAG: hypothetical protein M1833_000586 [Piccolia ochrophora]